jgi:hypothetical protein
MGICTSSRKDVIDKNAFINAIESKEDVWEIKVSILVKYVKENHIPQLLLSIPPLLCNYIILEKMGNRVIRIKMDDKSGTYKKYITNQSLQWHLSLKGLPKNASVLLNDKQLYDLHYIKYGKKPILI